MENAQVVKARIYWIDWFKTLGMLFVVFGHMFPPKDHYIYAFNVPLFFILSGFLAKREENAKLFWKKLFYNMIVPLLVLALLSWLYNQFVYEIYGEFSPKKLSRFVFGVLLGKYKYLRECWFIYTLVIIKIIYQYLPQKWEKIANISLVLVFTLVAVVLSVFNKFSGSAFLNVVVSYQFFALGLFLSKYKSAINGFRNIKVEVAVLLVSLAVLYLSGRYHGAVWMFINDYGKNIVLFFTGGISGTVAVSVVARWLAGWRNVVVDSISTGSIVLLGLHFPVAKYLSSVTSYNFLAAVAIVLAFVPVIMFCERYIPWMIGLYRVRK